MAETTDLQAALEALGERVKTGWQWKELHAQNFSAYCLKVEDLTAEQQRALAAEFEGVIVEEIEGVPHLLHRLPRADSNTEAVGRALRGKGAELMQRAAATPAVETLETLRTPVEEYLERLERLCDHPYSLADPELFPHCGVLDDGQYSLARESLATHHQELLRAEIERVRGLSAAEQAELGERWLALGERPGIRDVYLFAQAHHALPAPLQVLEEVPALIPQAHGQAVSDVDWEAVLRNQGFLVENAASQAEVAAVGHSLSDSATSAFKTFWETHQRGVHRAYMEMRHGGSAPRPVDPAELTTIACINTDDIRMAHEGKLRGFLDHLQTSGVEMNALDAEGFARHYEEFTRSLPGARPPAVRPPVAGGGYSYGGWGGGFGGTAPAVQAEEKAGKQAVLEAESWVGRMKTPLALGAMGMAGVAAYLALRHKEEKPDALTFSQVDQTDLVAIGKLAAPHAGVAPAMPRG